MEVERLRSLEADDEFNLGGTEQIERHVKRTRNQNASGQSVVECDAAPALLLAPPSIGYVMADARDLEAHGRVDVMADLTSKDAERLRTPSSEDSDQWVFVIDQRHRAPHGKTDMLNG